MWRKKTTVNFNFVSSVHTRRAEWPQEQGPNTSLYDFSGYSSHWAVWESAFNTSLQLCMSAQSTNIGSTHMEHLYRIICSGYQNTMNHFRKPKLKFKIMVLHRRGGDGVFPLAELHDKCFFSVVLRNSLEGWHSGSPNWLVTICSLLHLTKMRTLISGAAIRTVRRS